MSNYTTLDENDLAEILENVNRRAEAIYAIENEPIPSNPTAFISMLNRLFNAIRPSHLFICDPSGNTAFYPEDSFNRDLKIATEQKFLRLIRWGTTYFPNDIEVKSAIKVYEKEMNKVEREWRRSKNRSSSKNEAGYAKLLNRLSNNGGKIGMLDIKGLFGNLFSNVKGVIKTQIEDWISKTFRI